MDFKMTWNVCYLYLDAGVVLPVPHGLLEQSLVDAAASDQS